MKKLLIYASILLVISIIIPTIIVKTLNFVPKESNKADKEDKIIEKPKKVEFDGKVAIYDTRTQEVVEMPLEEYIKGVVAAEMPAEFHIEALKAQAVASRTYALNRILKYPDGNPGHPEAPLCTGVHCQAYLTLEELNKVHSPDWQQKYWGKIEEAVESTKGMVMYYDDEVITAYYHSTSGGMTEDAINVFNVDLPYLKAVESLYEEDAPKYKATVTMTIEEFIDKLNSRFPGANINKDNLTEKVKLVERTESGRVKKISIDGTIVDGREIRELFALNSTNFKIYYNPSSGVIDIETIGYGHGVGMSQWGANGMAKKGKTYEEILKHYYTGVTIKQLEYKE